MKDNLSAHGPRIAILYAGLSDYSAACQRALQALYGARLLVVHWPLSAEAPFDPAIYAHIDQRIEKNGITADALFHQIASFDPDALLISGWMDKDYLAIARKFRQRRIPVIAGSDTQYSGKLRQRLGRLIAPWYLHTAIDVLWVTGERQKQLAHYLGYSGTRCWTGFYACNWQRFAETGSAARARAFLFTGRYIERKGIRVLLDAYAVYRRSVSDPWELWTVGTGNLREQFNEIEGIRDLGFVQPVDLPAVMHAVGAFVLPSNVEPWGVALQEAGASRLPLICSDACGAGVHLVRPLYNGLTFATGNARDLSRCLNRISSSSALELEEMGERSFELSRQYTPECWAKTLVEGIQDLKPG